MKNWCFKAPLFVLLSLICFAGSLQTHALAARGGGRGVAVPTQRDVPVVRQQVSRNSSQDRGQMPAVTSAAASRDQRPAHDPLVQQHYF